MSSPHSSATESEALITIPSERFQHREDFVRLRIILRQPSPHWDEFGLSQFSLISTDHINRLYETSETLASNYSYEINLLNE